MKVIDGLDLANQQLHSLADGSAATDGVTLQQLQAYVRGLDWKESVRTLSTANITVASPGATINGVTMAAADRVLLKDQTTASENGIYVFATSSTPLVRSSDASSSGGVQTLTSGMAVLATEGTVNSDTAWVLTTHDPIVVGTTALTFAQFGGGNSYTGSTSILLTGSAFSVIAVAGGGISIGGSGISIDFTKAVAKYAVTVGNGSLTTIVINHALNSTDVTVSIKNTSTLELVYMGAVVTDANNVTLTFPTAPSSNLYRVVVHA